MKLLITFLAIICRVYAADVRFFRTTENVLLPASQAYLGAGIATDVYLSQGQPEANPFYMRQDGTFNTQKGIAVGAAVFTAVVLSERYLTSHCSGKWCKVAKWTAIAGNAFVGTQRLRVGLEH